MSTRWTTNLKTSSTSSSVRTVSKMPSSRSAPSRTLSDLLTSLSSLRRLHQNSRAHNQKDKRHELWIKSYCDERATIGNSNPINCGGGVPLRGHSEVSLSGRSRSRTLHQDRNPCSASDGALRRRD